MTSYKPDPDSGPGYGVEDKTPIPRHEFTAANELDRFAFDEGLAAQVACADCAAFCVPADLGEAVDWALGHECAGDKTGGE